MFKSIYNYTVAALIAISVSPYQMYLGIKLARSYKEPESIRKSIIDEVKYEILIGERFYNKIYWK